MDQNSNSGQQDRASTFDASSTSDAAVERIANQLFEREKFTLRTKAIVQDYVDSVPFMKKVQEYASDEVKRCYSTDRYEARVYLYNM
jgi:hypothetical protein